MKKEKLFLTILLAFLWIGAVFLWRTAEQEVNAVRNDLSAHILRFHVLANSDSPEDQALKLKVKEAILDYIDASLPDGAGLEETKNFLLSHEEELRTVATDVIGMEGYDYPVEFRLEPWYFPTKSYGDMTFPSGTYEAFRVIIGKGGGQNWWCVLYPSLCFVDATCGYVPEDSKQELQTMLDEDTYESLLAEKPKVRFRLLEWLEELF